VPVKEADIYLTDITLGSLFDGVGAFPLAASYFGIKPLWASEILPNAVSVTRRHFPDMAHLGDVTQLDGGKIPPVHILAFGSPCQSFSVAGDRKSFQGKSGLFFEAIRIIQEMRAATHGKYPEIVCFENVTGLLSVDSRRSYKTVLEAFCQAEIPMPASGRWANAGMVRGRGVDLAWVVKDSAQHFRVPQRRKRLFLIADFTGERAGEILFISQSLSGYFAARQSERESVAAAAPSGAGSAGGGRNSLTPWDYQTARIFSGGGVSPTLGGADMGGGRNPAGLVMAEAPPAAFMAGQAKNARSIAYSETVSPTLKGSPSGLNQMPCICEPQAFTMRLREGCAGGGKGPLIQTERSGTLATGNDQYLFCAEAPDAISFAQNQRCEVRDLGGLAGSLAASPGMKQQTYVAQCGELPAVHPTIAGTLCGSGAGLARPAGIKSETDLCVVIPETVAFIRQRSDAFQEGDIASTQTARQCKDATDLVCEPIPIHDKATRYKGGGPSRKNDGAGNGLGIGESGGPVPTMTAGDRHIVAAVDCRNLNENNVSNTLQSKSAGGYSLNYQNPVRTGYIIRRLTPIEAERLMALPDGWTATGHDGKIMSDSARYSMCGNSIVVNVLAYIMQNIAAALRGRR
jgi:DNA (cytosine-5)-methyltransferase 1